MARGGPRKTKMKSGQRPEDALASGVGVGERVIEHADSRRRRLHGSRPRLLLNLTAMIDVVFLLLMYFLLITEFRPREDAIEMALPPAQAGEVASDPFALPRTPIRVYVRSTGDARGAFTVRATSSLLDDVSGGSDDLSDALVSLRGDALPDDQRFVVSPEGEARWEHVVEALSAIRAAGFVDVRLDEPERGS